MRSFDLAASVGLLAFALACGGIPRRRRPPPARSGGDPATAGTVTATVKFEGTVPAPEMIMLTGDPKCVSENGAPQRADEKIVVGDNQALQNVFVYVKDGLGNFGFPVPTEPVVLDQDKCRYTPSVLGVRVGQPLQIHNGDPLLHNVRSNGVINQAFNKSTPIEGMTFDHNFATQGSDGAVQVRRARLDERLGRRARSSVPRHHRARRPRVLGNLPPGTYTIEAWHESLPARRVTIAIGKDIEGCQLLVLTLMRRPL